MATILDTLVAQIVFKGDTKALDNVNQRLKQFSTNLNAMGRKFGLAGGAITAFSGLSLKSFAGFDDAMTQSLAIMEDVSDAMRKDMAKAAKDVALTTRFSAKDAAASYFFLASAGLDAKQSIEALPQVAQFAQAGMFNMAQATDLLTDAQSALGLTVKDDVAANMRNMLRVSDTLVQANRQANASVQQFSEALTNRAGVALRALGKDVEEGVAVLAAYADQGEKGQRAGEQLNIVLRDLQKSALDNRSAFDQAGVTVFDASGEMANLADIIGDLEDHLAGMSDEQKRAALTALGFQEQSLASLTTLLGTSDAIREYEAELRNATGTTASVAEKQLQSLAAQFDLLKSHVEVAMINIGGAIAPLVEALFGPLSAALSWVSGLFESNNRFARIAAQGVAILGGGLVVLSGVLFGTALAVRGYAFALTNLKIPQMIATLWNSNFILSLRMAAINVRGFVASLSLAKVALLAGAAATGIATVATAAFGVALTIATGPIGLIILGIAALIAGIVLLVKHWDTVKDALKTVWNFVKGNWQEIAGLLLLPILGPFALIATNAFGLRDKLIGVFKGIWNWFRDSPVFGPLIDGATQAIEMIKTLLDWTGKIEGAFSWVKSKLGFGEDEGDPNAPSFGRGGMVPGPTGRPLAAVVHGGEMILPPDVARVMSNLMRGPASTPSALYPVPALAGPSYSTQTMSKASEINIEFSGDIVINAPQGSDPHEIARIVNEEIGERFRDVVHNFDDGILR